MRTKQINTHGIILFYSHPYTTNAPTILEHVYSFERYSKQNIISINTEFGFPKKLLDYSFSIIILHYSLFGNFPFRLKSKFIRYIKESNRSYKIAFFQDEHQFCSQRFSLINDLNINCIYSLLDPEYYSDIYFKNTNVEMIYHTLTGYVDRQLIEKVKKYSKPIKTRTIDVGYRARRLPFYMGKGAQEKFEIANLFINKAKNLDLKLDINADNNNRIYGDDWYKFIANCHSMIGVEAGVSIFDVENKVKPAVTKLISENSEISFEQVSKKILKNWENRIYYRTISPRIFEAAAFKVSQVLYEGSYQGILKPMIHYIPLKKDFSNFDEVIKLMKDEVFVMEMVDRAFEDLIVSGQYSYKKFIAQFDSECDLIDISRDDFSGDLNNIAPLIRLSLYQKLINYLKILNNKNWPGKKLLIRVYHLIR